MTPVLRLFEDVLSSDVAVNLPALPRMMFVAHGSVVISDHTLHDGEATGSEGIVALKAGSSGATLWRWEMATQEGNGAIGGTGVSSREKLTARLDTLPKGSLLLRGDSVAFPPAAAPICIAIRGRVSGVCSKAASASTRTAARRHTGRAVPGTKAGPTRSSRRPPTGRRVSFAP